ncbi:MAG TPA: hypothetical protein VFE30_14525 [Anaeromyxobacteraceae bacterium]|jgi:hypothetical protein|nr:hypothetical protein [Anaeromyxobacteraceae bacterium]
MRLLLTAALLLAAPAAPARHLLVVCSPGAPGTTAEAQPTMDAFAAALSAKAGLQLAAVYDEAEQGGAARLRSRDAAVALVSLPFFLKHERELGLRARLQAVPRGRPESERWTLVAKKGRAGAPAALEGFTVVSSAGFAPAFVRGPALGGWGPLPASARVVQSGAVLSALRRAAAGERVAVLLDGAQEAALGSLPFAAELEVVTRSAPLPAGVVAAVDGRLPGKAWGAVEGALRGMASDAAGASALEAIQMTRFAPLDEKALAGARKAYAEAVR